MTGVFYRANARVQPVAKRQADTALLILMEPHVTREVHDGTHFLLVWKYERKIRYYKGVIKDEASSSGNDGEKTAGN